MSDRQTNHSRLAPHFLKAFWSASLQWSSLLSQLCFSPAHLQLSQVRPNNAFKPNALRSTKHMAGIACHVFGSTTHVGLTRSEELRVGHDGVNTCSFGVSPCS